MKHFLTFLSLLFSIQVYCQTTENSDKEIIQEGIIYHFDSRKHMCGQMYYIATENDTVSVDRRIEKTIELKELPIEIYFTISGDDRCGAKTLSYIEKK